MDDLPFLKKARTWSLTKRSQDHYGDRIRNDKGTCILNLSLNKLSNIKSYQVPPNYLNSKKAQVQIPVISNHICIHF